MFLRTNFEETMRGYVVKQPTHDARLYTNATRAYMYARPAEHNTRAYARDANRDSRACTQNFKIAK